MALIFKEPFQQELISAFNSRNYSAFAQSEFGTLKALKSAENLANVPRPITLTELDGKRRQVKIVYMKRGLESEVQATLSDCNNCIDPSTFSVTFDADQAVSFCRTLSLSDLQKIQTGDRDFITQTWKSWMDAVWRKVNKQLITLLVNGKYADGSTTKSFPLMVATVPQVGQEVAMLDEMRQLGVSEAPIVIGANAINQYVSSTRIQGNLNTTQGYDLRSAGQFWFFYDRWINIVLASTNNGLMIAPGVAQIVTYNRFNPAYNVIADGVVESFPMMDNETGMEFQIRLLYDACTHTYKIMVEMQWGLAQIPKGIYQTGDDAFTDPDDVNGVLPFTT